MRTRWAAYFLVLVLVSVGQWAWQGQLNRLEAQLVEDRSHFEIQRSRLRLALKRAADEQLVGKPMVERLCRQAIEIEGLDWGEEQIDAMVLICWRESRYDANDQNQTSTAYGLYQFLDSTWQYTSVEKTPDPLLQTVAAVRYIEDRYDTPTEALKFHRQLRVVNGKRVRYY
ncbi:MAG: transglycosylase SLT domain-containing protein [Armatimonadetes bacterium]|nr:transglycosylase SLT domain-containing protein [Armatimonadota bacterium]